MPFSSPGTYYSKATTGYESTFSISASSPITYVAVLEVKSIKPNYASVPEVNVSHLLSPLNTEELRPGMIKPGTIDIGGNLIGDATQLQFTTLMQNQTNFFWEIVAPVQSSTGAPALAKTYTATGTAYVASYDVGPFENNKAIEFSVKLQITEAYTESVA